MLENQYQYVLDFYKNDGTALGRLQVRMDWQPALEWARFTAIRKGILPPVMSADASVITPLWNSKLGEPYLAGFRVTMVREEGEAALCDFPNTYFESMARRVAKYFVKKGDLEATELFQYLTAAFPRPEDEGARSSKKKFSARDITTSLALKETMLAGFQSGAKFFGPEKGRDVPLFVRGPVLTEAAALTRQAGVNETGGILVGFLHRDPDIPEVFLEVTAQLPAEHARSELASLTFTADTWNAAQSAIDLRGRGEEMLGWWHSHSFLKKICKECQKKEKGTCHTGAAFMSDEDCHLHRSIFPRAYNVALVVADGPCSGLTYAMYGWRHGIVSARGFYVFGKARSDLQEGPVPLEM